MKKHASSTLPGRRAFLCGLLAGAAVTSLPLSCLAAAAPYQQSALLMGTIVRVDVANAPLALAEEAAARAFARAAALEADLTRFDAGSPLGVLNAQGRLADVPPTLAAMLEASGQMHRLTAGSFDPSILPVLAAMRRGEEAGTPLGRAELAELLELVDYSRVRTEGGVSLESGMSLTLDGIAKGHIAQEMSRALTAAGCSDHLVNAGGDVVAHGSPSRGGAWCVGVRSPFHAQAMDSVVSLNNRALASSGIYEQPVQGGSGSHLVIPTSFSPRPETVACSVIAREGFQADALATAWSVTAPADVLRACRRLSGVEAILVLANGSVLASEGWPA